MKYYTRLGIYKASNVDFNPNTGLGHSYEWYEITKVIDNKLVLNVYGYSPSTIKHVYKLRSLLRELGRDFVEIEAPRGLQNLTEALEHTIRVYADELVRARHSRNQIYITSMEYASQLAIIRKFLKIKQSQKVTIQAIKDAETRRRERLDSARAMKKEKTTLTLVK